MNTSNVRFWGLLLPMVLTSLACPTRPIASADADDKDSTGGHGGQAGAGPDAAAGTVGSAAGHGGQAGSGADAAAGTADSGVCGGLGEACCTSGTSVCRIAGSVCTSSNVCGCPVGSHACLSSSCISDSSVCDIAEYPLPGMTPKPTGLALGPDGNIWFTDSSDLKVGRMSTSGSVAEFAVSYPPTTITAGPDGNLWFTEHGHVSGGLDQIGRIDPTGAHLAEFDLSADAPPTDPGNTLGGGGMIIAGPDQNLWFTESVPGKVARMTTGGIHTAYQVRAFYPQGITVGPDQNLWYSLRDGAAIGWLTANGTDNTETSLPAGTDDPNYLAVGADSTVWITETMSNLVTHYLPSTGKLAQSTIPTPNSFPGPIVLGPDGNMWSIGFLSNNIIRISPAGAITEFPLPTAGAQPTWIVKGPDVSGSGTLWIAESARGKLARIIP